MNKYLRFFCILTTLVLALNSCATTTLQGVWVNPDLKGKSYHKMLVLGICENQTYLRMFEDALSRRLSEQGVTAESGYRLFPGDTPKDKDEMTRLIAQQGYDTVMVSRVTGRRVEEVRHPGRTYFRRDPYYEPRDTGWGWYDYYYRSYEIIHEPPYTSQYKVITIESNVYDTTNTELVWSAVSETVVEGSVERLIDSLADTLAARLVQSGLF